MTTASESIGKATARGAAWLTLQTLSARVFSLLSQLVLAWLLAPSDFGLIGLAYTVTTIARTLVSFGVDDVLLQRQRTIRLWQSSAFWTSLVLAVIGTAVVLIAAPVGARLYHSPKLIGLVAIMAIAMPIGALSTVSAVTIRAQMGFRFLALYNTFEIAATQLLTILFAFGGFGPYSFALPLPLLAAVKTFLFWRKSPPRIQMQFRISQLRYLAGSGSKVFVTRLLIEGVSQGDYITLGVLASHAVVGAYFFAFRLAAQPLRILAGNFSNVLFPALAQLNQDPERQVSAALNAARLLAYIAMPTCFIQAALAGPFLRLCFGSKWTSAIPLVQALSIGLPFDAVSWIAGSLMSARGEFRRQLLLTAGLTPIFFAFVITGARFASAEGVAWAVTIYYVLTGPLYGLIAFGRRGVASRTVLSLYLGAPVLAALSIGLCYDVAQLFGVGRSSDVMRFAMIGLLGPLVYLTALHLVLPDIPRQALDRVGFHRLMRRVRTPLFAGLLRRDE